MGKHNGFMLSLFLFAVVVDVVNKLSREGVLSELLFADDLVLMKGLRNTFLKSKEAFASSYLKLTSCITKGENMYKF